MPARYSEGDTVRIVLDATDSDYDRLRERTGESGPWTGTVVDVFEDDLGGLTGNQRDSYMYTIDLDAADGTFPARAPDLQPA